LNFGVEFFDWVVTHLLYTY